MPFLAGGWHLPTSTKIALTNVSLWLMITELRDEPTAGDWRESWQDAGAVFQFASTIYILWVPPVVQASIAARVGLMLLPLSVPAAVLTSVVTAGGIASTIIDPEDGLDNFIEFMTGEVSPKQAYDVILPQVQKKEIAAAHWVDDRLMDIQHTIEAMPGAVIEYLKWRREQAGNYPWL